MNHPHPHPHARAGRVLVQMAVIIAVGFIIGLADAYVFRPVDLSARPTPESIADVLRKKHERETAANNPGAPRSPVTPPANTSQPATPTPSNTIAPSPAPADGTFQFTAKADMPAGQITVDEAKQLFDAGAVFIDARNMESFKEGHVKDAFRLESEMFKTGDPDILKVIARDSILVVYCKGGHCDESENVAKLLSGSGYKSVYVMHDGYPGWKAAGHATETGEPQIQ